MPESFPPALSVLHSPLMARNKESLVLLLDVGPVMHKVLPEIEKICSILVQKKLIYSRSDEIGIVLFGTKDTYNDLMIEVGGYENVVVLRNIKVVDGDLVEALQHLPHGTVAGDFIDAIVVGMDMLIKKYGETNKGKKRLCLITSAQCPIKDPYEGTKEGQVNTIADQMAAHGMKIDCIVARGKLTGEGDKKIMDENDFLLNQFSKKTRAKTLHVESPTALLGALKTRNIAPVTIFRGDLEISEKMKIKVWVYKKTSEERFPTLKKFSDKAPPTDKFATHEVKIDFEYKSVQNPSTIVPPEQRIKGFCYGPQVVPISPAELDATKFKTEKGVKLLGFTNASNIMRHYYMKDVNIFIAEPGNTKAILAVSAIARAMKETNTVAILRCVWRQGQGNVNVGVLTPNVSDRDNLPDSFFFNVLPFAEDIREFQFPSFSKFHPSWQPNKEQQEAADNLVKMLNLTPPDKAEALQPDLTPNPVLERFYHCLELKSKHPDAAVPPLDETLKKITEPDPELLSQNKHVIDAFCRCFEVKENPKLKKSTKRLMRDEPSGSHWQMGERGVIGGFQAVNSKENESTVKVEEIGRLTPIQDFETLMNRRDSPEWISKAIKGMQNRVFDLVEDSFEGDNYVKALECLRSLRKGCILEQEPKQFNDFLGRLCNYCRTNHLDSFNEFLLAEGVMLITKTEAIDSEVTEEEARSFFAKGEPTAD